MGLAAFGECAPNLVTLNISNMPHLQSWAFQRLVSGCVLIEDLDCSNCDRLTDHDMTVMAQHCSKLRRLIVKDTRQLTDASLVDVARHCETLEHLDTTRSEMPWKITDVGLLGLAECCPLLRTLVCQGCDQISDVS